MCSGTWIFRFDLLMVMCRKFITEYEDFYVHFISYLPAFAGVSVWIFIPFWGLKIEMEDKWVYLNKILCYDFYFDTWI